MPAKKKTPATKRSTTRRPARPAPTAESSLNFTALVDAIRQVHEQSAALVNRTVNTTLTLRNWVIGAYIHHYELTGLDRAKYGEGLLDALADRLTELHVSNCNRRQLYRYLRFWRLYPAIVGTVSPQFPALPAPVQEVGTVSPQLGAPVEQLVNRLSYSHLELIVDLEDPLNPPLGLLLCTDKDHALVQYATASIDNQLFVSKYSVELPSKAELEKFLHGKHLEMLGEA